MINKSIAQDRLVRSLVCVALVSGMLWGQVVSAATITLSLETSVPDADPTLPPTVEPVEGFRYLVEEDTTHVPDPGTVDYDNSLSFNFHRSHNPVATADADRSADATSSGYILGDGISGHTTQSSVDIVVPDNKRYFVSVVPFNGHAVGGGAIEVGTAAVSKSIRVSRFPIPTAQISIWVFEDNNPVNGALDIDERRLAFSMVDGQRIPFKINLFDAAGQYGAAGGHVTQDAYGNPLGTEYHPTNTNADGSPQVVSTPDTTNGFVLTPNDNGELIIKNLPPAKYGVQVIPPAGEAVGEPLWVQTSTIEGSKTIDVWVKANEPETFVEFGPPGPHVFVGFVQTFDCLANPGIPPNHDSNCFSEEIVDGDTVYTPLIDTTAVGASVSGNIVNNHMSRPPFFDFANGEFFEGCRIAVNIGIQGRTVYSQPCGNEASFGIDNLPPGAYTLSIWDDGLNVVIASHAINVVGNAGDGFQITPVTQLAGGEVLGTVPASVICDGIDCSLGQIPVFDWFHFADTVVFHDQNENGYRDCVTAGCEDPAVDDVSLNADASETILRWRDGRVYKALGIDGAGSAPHEEVFPFFHWLVAEVGFANHKATGATFIVDAGGDGPGLQADGYVPQDQGVAACDPDAAVPVTTNCSYDGGVSRTDTGPVLTQAFQGFLGQKNFMQFGKKAYGEGENGGISGLALYAITRAEDDPAYAAAEEWEPGIPRVQIALFDSDFFENILHPVTGEILADPQDPDVDNHPLGWSEGGSRGPEDVDHNGNGTWDQGDAMDVTWTDSWDDSLPESCAGDNSLLDPVSGDPLVPADKCFDGLRNFNQLRPGVFDGGYAFGGETPHMPAGYYVVKSYTPPGYELMREEHKNVDFGDEYALPTLLPTKCVGADHVVPDLLAHVTVEDPNNPGQFIQVVDGDPADYAAPYAGETRQLCDARHVRVADGKNAAADFHYMTPVPKAAHVVGGVINDLGNEFNAAAPTFGEKFAPPWIPVAFYDYQGHEIHRVYTDQFGKYNAMLPSTNTVNVASPSGVAPNMITACMNDSGLIDDPSNPGVQIVDPRYNPQYSQFCYVFQYMPGGTTYLDTPVLQIAAFAGAGKQLDCALADATPVISEVTGPEFAGPYLQNRTHTLTIKSPGLTLVPNPSSDELTNRFDLRNYGFGLSQGTGSVELVRENNANARFPMSVSTWSDGEITAVPAGNTPNGRFQLVVTHDNGNVSQMAVTVTIRGYGNAAYLSRVHVVEPNPADNSTPIQDAIDAAGNGDTILVTAGVYNEIPILYKPVYLQGAGAYSTSINARSAPTEIIEVWQAKMTSLLDPNGIIDLIPGQEAGPGLFATEAGAGITVVASEFGDSRFANQTNRRSRIDGFTITGASTGGGVFANGFVKHLYVSNNLITGNQGTFGGGVRLGHAIIVEEFDPPGPVGDSLRYSNAQNHNVRIRHNMITQNGNLNGAGGGISLYNDSDNYRITDNLICGNYAATDGAGIGHLGKSDGGIIADNQILFNQSFRQSPGFETDGGGILIAGNPGLNGSVISDGSGDLIRIDRNLIQGNQAGAGDGGGIALRRVSGVDVADNPGSAGAWNRIYVRNNSIVNNMAGLAGGGISLKDAPRVFLQSNTIAHNDSTATAGLAFNDPEVSTPQVAGIVSRQHESLAGLITLTNARYGRGFSNPVITDSIIWHNRSFFYDLNTNALLPDPATPTYVDLGIIPPPANPNWRLTPRASLLSDASSYHADNLDDSEVDTSGLFISDYLNGNPFLSPSSPSEFKTIQVAPALDEGGNWIDVRYAPLSVNDIDGLDDGIDTPSDYHLAPGSAAINAATGSRPTGIDIDREPGTVNGLDMGSDEVQ